MSRHGYSELDQWPLIRWRGAVASAIRGKRGQKLLRDMAEALDAMTEKKLTRGTLKNKDGEVCALGAVLQWRGIQVEDFCVDMSSEADYSVDVFGVYAEQAKKERKFIADGLDVAPALVAEISYLNDDAYAFHRRYSNYHTDEKSYRWLAIRRWVQEHLNYNNQNELRGEK